MIEAARTYPSLGLYASGNRVTNVKLTIEALRHKYEMRINDSEERLSNEDGIVKSTNRCVTSLKVVELIHEGISEKTACFLLIFYKKLLLVEIAY